jgi:hypothetical protein
MELKNLREHPIAATFSDGDGEECAIVFNGNAFTPSFLRVVAEKLREMVRKLTPVQPKEEDENVSEGEQVARELEANADFLEIEREVYADMLASRVLTKWDVTDGGQPVPITKEVLASLHPRTVKGLWDFCAERSSPKKRQTLETQANPTTEEITDAG